MISDSTPNTRSHHQNILNSTGMLFVQKAIGKNLVFHSQFIFSGTVENKSLHSDMCPNLLVRLFHTLNQNISKDLTLILFIHGLKKS